MLKITALCVAFLVAGCSGGIRVGPERTTIHELLRAGLFYNNAVVEVRGFAVMRFEAHYICQTLAEVDSGQVRNCLWIAPVPKNGVIRPLDAAQFHQKKVLLTGVFDRDMTGHGGAYGGAIAVLSSRVLGSHDKGDIPAPPEPSANSSFKPTPLRGAA